MTDKNSRPKIVWDAESTHPELMENLRQKLREVVDPEIGLNIIQLGLVRNVRIEADQAEINMILTTPFCPYGPAMLEVTREKAQSVLNMPVSIDLGMQMWDPSMMEEDAAAEWGFF